MITIQIATEKDVNDIVNIHNKAFPDFFLTTLGSGFLRLYYKCMCRSKEALALCAVDGGEVVGFSATALKSAGFNTRLIKNNKLMFMGETCKLLFTRPKALIRLAKNMTKSADGFEDDGNYAELYSIGVSPTCQGQGVGSRLLSENERIIRSGGGKKYL